MIFERRTLANPARLEGVGLHGGVPVEVTIHPGECGIWFRCGAESVEARPENVTDTKRSTRLGNISTIEHLMSAFAGLEITDAEVELTAPELPSLDGSAKPFADALADSGFESIGQAALEGPFARVFLQEDGAKIAVSTGTGHWGYRFETPGRWPGDQSFESENVVSAYAKEIAPARTFGFESEIPAIRAAGMAKGLDFDSALVIGESGYANAARFDDEPARHKLLDALGDLYLSGVPVRFLNVSAERSGHRLNVQAARMLAEAAKIAC